MCQTYPNLQTFISEEGPLGVTVLRTLNDIDPLRVILEPQAQQDEYLTYAQRLIIQIKLWAWEKLDVRAMIEIVSRAFSPAQIRREGTAERYKEVHITDIERIAEALRMHGTVKQWLDEVYLALNQILD